MSNMPNREQLWHIFQTVDTDRSGAISAEELQGALSNGSWAPFNMETVRLMIGMYGSVGTSTVNFEQFGALWRYIMDWQRCFLSFDHDNSGKMDHHELRTALSSFGYRLNDQTISMLIRKHDRLGNGTILFDDFIQCCIVLHTLTNAFRQQDTDNDGCITIHYEQFLYMVAGLKLA